MGPGLKVCISNKLPGNFEVSGLWTLLGVAIFTVISWKGTDSFCSEYGIPVSVSCRPQLLCSPGLTVPM